MNQVKKVKLVVIISIIFISFLGIYFNKSYAASNFCQGFKIKYGSNKGNNVKAKTIAGIFYAMRINHGNHKWVDSENPYDKKKWGTESFSEQLDKTYGSKAFDDVGKSEGNPVYGMVFRWGSLCFGHQRQNGDTTKNLSEIINIDGSTTSDVEKLKLSYYIFANTHEPEQKTPKCGIIDIATKAHIYNWIITNSEIKVQDPATDNLIDKTNDNKFKKYEKNANEYTDKIQNINIRIIKDTSSKLEIKKINNKNYTFIGPYHLVTQGGTLDNVVINGNINTTKCSTNGKDIIDITNLVDKEDEEDIKRTKKFNNFYVVLEGNTLQAANRVTIYKSYKYYVSRIVLSKARGANGQDVAIFDGYEDSKTITCELPTAKFKYGSLLVVKEDKNTFRRLANVGFKIKNTSINKWIKKDSNGISYVDKEENATEFKTNSNGERKIINLRAGKYQICETKNPNPGYGEQNLKKNIEIKEDEITNCILQNERKNINISGYVWIDKILTKETGKNNLYDEGYEDTLEGINVKLIKKGDLTATRETTTNSNGEYVFKNIPITELKNYYVEFEYDEFKYEAVECKENESNGSKAIENSATRTKFNEDFSSVEGKTENTCSIRDTNNKEKYTLGYDIDKSNHVATIMKSNFSITANTKNLEDYYSKNKEVTNINLGLYEREQPDIALAKDLYNVNVAINGYNHIYEYAQRGKINAKSEDNAVVMFNNKYNYENYGSMSYTRAIYKSDIEELKVYVTYKISMKNESTNLKVKVNSILDYYDSKYKLTKAGTGIDNSTGNITGEIEVTENKQYMNDKYRKATIKLNSNMIKPNEHSDIYVQFELNRDDKSKEDPLLEILNNKESLDNVAEINSYSVFDTEGSSYAGIDQDSNPGNAVPGDETTYEDDTDYAPGLKLEVANPREIKGTVFEDNAVDPTEGGTNRERLGNGKFDDGEKTISGVKVGLYKEADFDEIKDEDGKIIDMQLNLKAKPVGTTTYGGDNKDSTGKDGAFTIKDFAPGEYRIVYFWGDGKYTIEDYKSTIWTSANKNEKDGNPNTWYRVKTDKRYSDALDNYDTRLKIDRGDTSINKMDSKTPTMVFGVELADDIDNKKTETSEIDKVTFSIEKIDFGVIERPRQSIDVTKRVKSMKVTLANGQVIADAKIIEKDGKLQLEEQAKGVAYIQPSANASSKNGMIKAEIDNELIQGATVEIKYEIKVQNNSEIDYDSKSYYCYGEKEVKKIVKIKASGVYDYLDNTMIANDENTEWETKTIENYNEEVSKPTVIEEYLHKYQSSSTDASGNTEIRIGYEKFEEQYSETKENWKIENIITARKKRLADKTILHNANLEEEIAPGYSKQASLTASKILTNTDEIELNNDIEITETTRNTRTGRNVTPQYSIFYDKGETVIITKPTGENKNYILITIVAISFFVILGTGVVFIKKKILK